MFNFADNKYTVEYKYCDYKIRFNNKVDILNIYFNTYRQYSSVIRSSKMHYMKRSIQEAGWKEDYNVFFKKRFYFNYYVKNKNKIPKDEKEAKEVLKVELSKYIGSKSPEKTFRTKFMAEETEKNLYNKISVKDIESGFDKHLKHKILKLREPNNLHINKLPELQLEVINYFILQKTRSPLILNNLLEKSFIKDIPLSDLNQHIAYYFRMLYNKEIKNIFRNYWNDFYIKNIRFKIIDVEITSSQQLSKNLVTLGEINCISLNLYNELTFGGFLNKFNEYNKDINIAAISGNKLYALIKNYDESKEYIYQEILNIIGNTWNSFSFVTSYEYLVCPSSETKFLEYLTNMIYDAHKVDALDMHYTTNISAEKVLNLERMIF